MGGRKEIVFVLDTLADWQSLATGAQPGQEVVIVNGKGDVLGQVAGYLSALPEGSVDAVHLMSHGSVGALDLGGSVITTANLAEHGSALAAIGTALTANGDLMLYGCDVGQGAQGQQFLQALANLTQADVAASANLTGAPAAGGDWVLEAVAGRIEAAALAPDYAFSLAAQQSIGWPLASVWVRPGGTSYTWTWGIDSTNGNHQITQVAFFSQPSGQTPWFLEYGRFEYSLNAGTSWTTYNVTNTSYNNPVTTAGTLWRFVDTNSSSNVPDPNGDRIAFSFTANNISYGSSGFGIYEDAAPTDITLTPGASLVSDMPTNGTIGTLTPVDTGLATKGYWAIDSQSISGLFTLTSDPNTGNTAALKVADPSKLPADGQQASVTVRYYDLYQTDTSGQPIVGQGVSKTFTFPVLGATRDLDFTSDIKVNSQVNDTADQVAPSIAGWSNGEFVVTWYDSTAGGVYAQKYSSQGVAQGGRITIDGGATAGYPSVTTLANGAFAVAYGDTATYGTKLKFVDSAGSVGGATAIASSGWDGYSPIGISVNAAKDQVVVTWGEFDTQANAYTNTHSAVYNAAGVLQGAPTSLALPSIGPAVAWLANGTQVIASIDGNSYQGINLVVNGVKTTATPIGDGGYYPSVAALSGGGFVLAYSGSDGKIYFSLFDNSGVETGGPIQANTSTGTADSARVAVLSDGSFVITWNDPDGAGGGVSGRRFDPSGVALDTAQFHVNELRYGDQGAVAVAALDNGKFAAVWTDYSSDKTSKSDIEARVLLSSNTNVNPAPVLSQPSPISLVDTAAADQFSNVTGTLSASDANGIAAYGIQGGSTGASTTINGVAYDVTKAGTYGTLYVVSTGADQGKYVFVPNAAAVNALASGNTSETFTVTAKDANANPATGTSTLTVNVTGANDTPTGITLPTTTVSQSGGINAAVGTMVAIDPDANQTHVFSLVSGSGSDNNASFNISGSVLRANDASALPPGAYSVRVRVSDGTATYEKVFSVTVQDDTAPRITSIEHQSPAASPTNASSLSYSVTFSKPVTGVDATDFTVTGSTATVTSVTSAGGNAFNVVISGGDLATANGTVTLGLAPGQNIRDTSSNALTNTSPTGTNNASYVVDHAAPAAPTTPDLQAASDSGLNTDNITNVTTPTFTGTAEVGSTVTLHNGGTVLGTAIATGGNWSITASSALAQGTHSITAQATDAAGNVGAASSGLSVTIDTAAPTGLGLSASSVSVPSAVAASNVATIQASDDQAITYALATGNGSNDLNNGSFTIAGNSLNVGGSSLSAGAYKVYLSATDVAGNVSYLAQTITVNNGPSVASIVRAGSAAQLTNAASPTFTITFSETVSGVSFDDFALTGTSTGGIVGTPASSDGGLTWTVQISGASEGTLGLDLKSSGTGIQSTANNAAITGGYTGGQSYTLDRTPPAAPAITTAALTNQALPTLSGTAESGSSVTVVVGGQTYTTTATAGAWSINLTSANPAPVLNANGSNAVSVTATDGAGNPSTAGTQTLVIDTTPPAAPVVTSPLLTNQTQPILAGTAEAGATVTVVVGSGNATYTTVANGSGAWSVNLATATPGQGSLSLNANGTNSVSVTARDAAGNPSQAGLQTLTIDTTPPSQTFSLPEFSSDTGSSGTDFITKTASQTIKATLSSGLGNGDKVYGSLDNGATWTDVTTKVAGTTLTWDGVTLTGSSTLKIKVTDAAGNDGTILSQAYVLDTVAPTIRAGTVTLDGDSGSSTSDFITNDGANQSLRGTLTGNLSAGEIVEVSLDNGTTWTPATALVDSSSWSLSGVTLAGSGTLQVRVTDAAGNSSAALSQAFTMDATAPAFNPAGGTPADNFASAATTGAIVLAFDERLDATPITGSVLTSVELREVGTNTVVPATVTINGSGQLVITPTASLKNSTAYYVNWGANALKDLAGNSVGAVADQTTYNFTTVAAPSDGGASTPPPGQSTVDGTTVQTGTTTNSNGTTTTTTTVAPVPANRPEDPSTPNNQLADIPLATAGGETVLQIGLPAGVGVTSSETSGNNLTLREKLMGASQPISLPADFAQLLQTGIDTFVPGVQDPSQVTVRTLTLSVAAGTVPGQPITITGANGTGESDAGHPQRQEALVIDARQLPAGSVLKFDKVEFAIVIGAVRIVGGEGANFVVGDSAAQFIVLGPDDDVLRGGGGDDVIGSHGGNDKLYGDDGNDTLVGGIGDDHLEGGAGNDVLIGGSADRGTWQFALGGDGRLHASYSAKEAALSDLTQGSIVGNWQGGEAIDPRLALVYNQDYGRLETTALLFQGLTGKLPTLDFQNFLSTPEWTKENLLQGAWNWYESTLPANLTTADKAKALITQTVGASLATTQNVQIAVDYLGQGGTWTQALDFLVHLPQVKGAITTQTAAGPLLNLIQPGLIAETGWSFDSGNDTLLGGAGNDVLIGGGGNDLLDGGEGTDMAVYVGQVQHYGFKLQTNASTGQQEVLVRMLANGEVDTLRSVELLQVGGQAYRIDTSGLQQGVDYTLAGHVQLVGAAELVQIGMPAF